MKKRSSNGDAKIAREEDTADSYSTYLEYNKVLRTWFIAFGIGGPALFLVNDKIAGRLVNVGMLKEVAILFLAGATAQIIGALLNKITNWYVYMSAHDANFRDTRQHKFSEWFTHQFWFDIAVDVITFICFGIAAWRILTVFA